MLIQTMVLHSCAAYILVATRRGMCSVLGNNRMKALGIKKAQTQVQCSLG